MSKFEKKYADGFFRPFLYSLIRNLFIFAKKSNYGYIGCSSAV